MILIYLFQLRYYIDFNLSIFIIDFNLSLILYFFQLRYTKKSIMIKELYPHILNVLRLYQIKLSPNEINSFEMRQQIGAFTHKGGKYLTSNEGLTIFYIFENNIFILERLNYINKNYERNLSYYFIYIKNNCKILKSLDIQRKQLYLNKYNQISRVRIIYEINFKTGVIKKEKVNNLLNNSYNYNNNKIYITKEFLNVIEFKSCLNYKLIFF